MNIYEIFFIVIKCLVIAILMLFQIIASVFTLHLPSGKMYAVVYFPDEDSVEVTPQSWVKESKNGTSCFWPPKSVFKGASLAKAVERGTPPEADWDIYRAEILKITGKLLTSN